jgi:hypothetical protein
MFSRVLWVKRGECGAALGELSSVLNELAVQRNRDNSNRLKSYGVTNCRPALTIPLFVSEMTERGQSIFKFSGSVVGPGATVGKKRPL